MTKHENAFSSSHLAAFPTLTTVTPRVPWTPIDVMQILFAWIVALFLGQIAYGILIPPKVEGQHEIIDGNSTLVVQFLPNNRYIGDSDNGTFQFAGKHPTQDRHTLIFSPDGANETTLVNFRGTERDRVGLIAITIVFIQLGAIVLVMSLLKKYNLKLAEAFGAIGNPALTFALPIALGTAFLFPALGLHHLSQSIIVFFGGEPSTQEAVKMVAMSNSQTELALQALSVMIFAPIAEELLFRGVIYTSIKQAGHPKLAIGFSAIIFATIHGSLALMLPLAALAWALVWIYEKTGTIIAPILMHATFNAINFSMIKFLPHLANQ